MEEKCRKPKKKTNKRNYGRIEYRSLVLLTSILLHLSTYTYCNYADVRQTVQNT